MKRPKQAPSVQHVRQRYSDAVDPSKAVAPVTNLRDMSPEKVAELEKLYGARIIPRAGAPSRPAPEKRVFDGREYMDLHPKCPNHACDSFMTLRQGKFGPFYGCMSFPRCRTVWSADDAGRLRGEPKI